MPIMVCNDTFICKKPVSDFLQIMKKTFEKAPDKKRVFYVARNKKLRLFKLTELPGAFLNLYLKNNHASFVLINRCLYRISSIKKTERLCFL